MGSENLWGGNEAHDGLVMAMIGDMTAICHKFSPVILLVKSPVMAITSPSCICFCAEHQASRIRFLEACNLIKGNRYIPPPPPSNPFFTLFQKEPLRKKKTDPAPRKPAALPYS